MLHFNPTFSIEIEFLKTSRLVLQMKIIDEPQTNKKDRAKKYNTASDFRKIFSHYLWCTQSNFNLSSRIGIGCWCDFGANLVQHFMRRYSRYSRYQTVLLKLQEIITHLGLFRYKTALNRGCCFLPLRVILSLSNFSVVDPVCTLFDAALQFDFASLRSGWHDGKARGEAEWNLGAAS